MQYVAIAVFTAALALAAPVPAAAQPAQQQAASPAVDEAAVVQHAVFNMADELDLAPRRVRGSLKRLVKRLRGANLSIEVMERRLEEWVAEAE